MKRHLLAGFLGAALLWASSAGAILIDPYDNVLAPDGFYGLAYVNYYTADEFTDSDGDKAAEVDFTATVGIARGLAYFHWGNLPMAVQLIVPFGKVEEKDVFDEDSSGLGDIVFGPGVFLYANQDSGTFFSYWLYFFAPTGEFDDNQAINLGQDHWYWEHQLAYNQIMGKFVFDMNLNLYHHFEEDSAGLQRPLRFELETSLAYQITDSFVFGVNGGGYWDLDEYEVDGDSLDDSEAVRIQFGPTLGYQVTERFGMNARWTHDFESENDTKGDEFWLRASYAF